MKAVRYLLAGLTALLLVALLAIYVEFFLTRGDTPAIDGERAVASLEQVELGGVPQWVLIRGADKSKPVVVFLHGGPGMPAMYLAHAFQREMERDFVMVHWDRRGAGKSFAANDGELTVSQTLSDTIELVETLRKRFAKQKVYLVGHSWGSYLGLLAARERPDLFRAFIGTGQLAGSWNEVRRARREFGGSEDLTEDDLFRLGGELYGETSFWPILRTGLFAPEYTFDDALNVKAGANAVARDMRHDVTPVPHEGEVAAVNVPVFFFLGRHDFNTPSELALEYLQRLESPLKAAVWFEESAHFPFFEEPGRFHEELLLVDRAISAYEANLPAAE